MASDDIVDNLENGEYIANNVDEAKEKFVNFLNFFNSSARLAMMQANKNESEEFVFLLFTLKKSIKTALSDIGKVHNRSDYNVLCGECGEELCLDHSEDTWRKLQNHEHFEKLYYKLPHDFDMFTIRADDNVIQQNETIIDYTDDEPDQENNNTSEYPEPNEDVNSFRFNFKLSYDQAIEAKLYPPSILKSMQKLDKCAEYSIQKSSNIRALCLLCCRELISRNRVSKPFIQEHVMGQRHLICAKTEQNLKMLKLYHETWLTVEMPYQAHQVYFLPEIPCSLRCLLCNNFVLCNYHQIKAHINKEAHKKKVLKLMRENHNNIFHLLELTLQVYGVEMKVEKKETEMQTKEKIDDKKKKDKPNKNKEIPSTSDSSPSSDPQEPAHNIITSVANSSSTNVLELIPNRFKHNLKYLKEKHNKIFCDICKLFLEKDIDKLKNHVMQTNHLKMINKPLQKYSYYCEICNLRFAAENDWQKHFTPGQNCHANMADSRKKRVTEYECTKCLTVIFGDELSLNRHLSVNKGKKVKKELKLPEGVKKLFSSIEYIESNGKKMAKEANNALKNNQIMLKCCNRLETALGTIFKDCVAYPFGSRVSGLGYEYSDLDVFIDVGGMYNGKQKQDPLSQIQFVRKAAGLFNNKFKDEFSDILTIATARTPIVRVIHVPTDIDCDLSFKHGLSVENTKFLRYCIEMQPIAQPLILLLKTWSEINNMKEHMSNYALSIMAIFYLQINGYLLSVKKLRELNPSNAKIINGWPTINFTASSDVMKVCVKPYPFTTARLLKDFFEYYAKFDYKNDVVCPLLGHIIKRDLFKGPVERLKPDMNAYVLKLHQEEDPELFRALSEFCVQDPFDLSHNLTKALQAGTLNRFKTLCVLTSSHLAQIK